MTVRNYDGDGNGNVKKAIGLMCKTTLHLHHSFLYISLQSLHNYDVKWPNLSLFGNGNGKVINSTTCVWTRPRSLLSSSNPNSPLLRNCTLRIIAKKSERMRSLFFSDGHGRQRCRIVRSLEGFTETPIHSANQAHHLSEDFRAGMSFVIAPIEENRECW